MIKNKKKIKTQIQMIKASIFLFSKKCYSREVVKGARCIHLKKKVNTVPYSMSWSTEYSLHFNVGASIDNGDAIIS